MRGMPAGTGAGVEQVFDDLPVAAAAIAADGLRVVVANRQARDWGIGEVVGASAADALTEPVASRMLPRLEEAVRTRHRVGPEEALVELGENRTELWIRWSLEPWYDADGTFLGVLVLASDVTAEVGERRSAASRLAGVEESYDVARGVVSAVQGALLPSSVPVLPRLDIAATYLVAGREQAAGGDWFDAAIIPDGRVSLVVGDVVGHGVAASAAMSQMRAVLASHLLDGESIERSLASMDRYAQVAAQAFATTVCVVVLDPDTGELDYATRGHVGPLVVGPTGARNLEPTGGGPLGVDATGSVQSARLGEDEAVVLFTDGLVERADRPLQAGLERVAAAAEQAVRGAVMARHETASVAERLCLHVPWALDDGYVDDVTMLVAARRPAVPDARLDIPAVPSRLASVRSWVSAWASAAGLDELESMVLVLAASEAAANSIEHGYGGAATGDVRLELRLRGAAVTLTVADDGHWLSPARDVADRGRGLAMVSAGGARVTVDASGGGTRVEFEVDARRRAPVPPLVTPREAPRPEGADVSTDGDGVVHVHGALDTGPAARRLETHLDRQSRGGVVPVEVRIAASAFLGSVAIRVLEQRIRGGQRDQAPVTLRVPRASGPARTLAIAGTPFVEV
ncbi:ATP-binding SpoIIE family protein phosphatase [Cellulomonas alba]|uniref:SpoIIE family protein phosphatase n=1 Tax=Cellulomonas alba TaxID=3053467 RepID=A0ABT7SCC2_9CELL|nr:SpoIIE family protein phosphatase [Cellulomonas alba]MDM7853833.1 SpoIIE family protein phosphatase [Cellulomonas alba]